jgi:hypothetical protein
VEATPKGFLSVRRWRGGELDGGGRIQAALWRKRGASSPILGCGLNDALSVAAVSQQGRIERALHRRAPGASVSAVQRWHIRAAGSIDMTLHGMRGDVMVPWRGRTGGGIAVRRW